MTENKVDIDYHVSHVALPPPGNWDQLTEICEHLSSLPLNMAMPLWRVYVIKGLDSVSVVAASRYAVLIKMHHASADGITATKMTSAIAETVREHSRTCAGALLQRGLR